MNRRFFVQALGALGFGTASPAGMVRFLPINSDLYARAVNWVGLWDQSSISLIKYKLGLDHQTASRLFEALVQDKVLAAPQTGDMARVITPRLDKPFQASKLDHILTAQKTGALIAKTAVKKTRDTPQNAVIRKQRKLQKPSVEDRMTKIREAIDNKIEKLEESETLDKETSRFHPEKNATESE